MISTNQGLKKYLHSQLFLVCLLAFSCKKEPSTVSVWTKDINNVSETSATCGGYIVVDYECNILEKGVCWSTNELPTIENSKTNDGAGIYSFSSNITGLSPNTTYYVRAYATNFAGTSYGEQVILKTYSGTVLDVEGNKYYTVTINDKIWMAENLKTTRYADGTPITLVETKSDWDSLAGNTRVYCWANDDIINKDIYGTMYNWSGAMNDAESSTTIPSGIQGVCPTGWHLPSDQEWRELETFLGGDSIAGGKMKETGRNHWEFPNKSATNESGFTALPGGYRDGVGKFWALHGWVFWWSSNGTDEYTKNAYYFSVYYIDGHSRLASSNKKDGCYVRCIKDY